MLRFISRLFRGDSNRPSTPTRPTTRLGAEPLESREVPAVANPYAALLPPGGWYLQQLTGIPASQTAPFSLAGVSGLPTPGPNATYGNVNLAAQQLNQAFRTTLGQAANLYNPQALQRAGLSSGLAMALSDAAQRMAKGPSILDARAPSVTEFNQAIARIKAGANTANYILRPDGFRRDLMIAGGYGHLLKMTAYDLANAAMRDPLIGLLSGNLTTEVTQRYLQRFVAPNGGFNAVGMIGAVGLGNTGVAAVLGQAQAIGATGLPPTYYGMPTINPVPQSFFGTPYGFNLFGSS